MRLKVQVRLRIRISVNLWLRLNRRWYGLHWSKCWQCVVRGIVGTSLELTCLRFTRGGCWRTQLVADVLLMLMLLLLVWHCQNIGLDRVWWWWWRWTYRWWNMRRRTQMSERWSSSRHEEIRDFVHKRKIKQFCHRFCFCFCFVCWALWWSPNTDDEVFYWRTSVKYGLCERRFRVWVWFSFSLVSVSGSWGVEKTKKKKGIQKYRN